MASGVRITVAIRDTGEMHTAVGGTLRDAVLSIADVLPAFMEAVIGPEVPTRAPGDQAPAGWTLDRAYDRWDQIIDEMEADGAWHNFTTTRDAVRRAIQTAVTEFHQAGTAEGWPPRGQVRREDEGAEVGPEATSLLEAIIDQRDRYRTAQQARVGQPIIHGLYETPPHTSTARYTTSEAEAMRAAGYTTEGEER